MLAAPNAYFKPVIIISEYSELVLSHNPISYWRLGETVGTTAVDEVAGVNGTYTGGYTLGVAGAISGNTAVFLNGTTGYIPMPFAAGLIQTGDLTLEAWVNFDSLPGTGTYFDIVTCTGDVFSEIETENYLYAMEISNDAGIHKFRYIHESGTGTNNIVTVDYTTTLDVFTHFVITRNVTTKTISFYVNGLLIGSDTYSNDPTGPASQVVAIGRANNDNVHFLPGDADEVAIYNYELTPTQILNHYNTAQ